MNCKRAYLIDPWYGTPSRVVLDSHGFVFRRGVGWSRLECLSREIKTIPLPGAFARNECLNWVYQYKLFEEGA